MGYKYNRKDILKQGIDLMSQSGYHGIGVMDILKSRSIPKGSFYNFFDSKEAFIIEAIELYGASNLKLIDRIEQMAELNPLEKVKAYFHHLIQKNKAQHFKYSCFWGNMSTEVAGQNEKVSAAIKDQMAIIKERFVLWLTEAQNQNILIDTYSPTQLADYLYTNFHGAMVTMKYQQSAQPLEDFLEINFRLLSKR